MNDYDPFSEEVATDPLPIYRELRAAVVYTGWSSTAGGRCPGSPKCGK